MGLIDELALVCQVVVLQGEILVCHIAEPWSLGAQRAYVTVHLLGAVVFPALNENLTHHIKGVQLSVENFIAELRLLFFFFCHCYMSRLPLPVLCRYLLAEFEWKWKWRKVKEKEWEYQWMYQEFLFFPAVFPAAHYFFPVFPWCVSIWQGKLAKEGFRFVSLHCIKKIVLRCGKNPSSFIAYT